MDNMFITGITAVTALVATVINLISGLSSIKKSKETIREEDYYNKVLRPYMKYLHESEVGKESEALKVFKETDINEPFIPPYIRHVYYSKNENRNEQLKKLLVIDYIKLYENEDRAIDRFFKVTDRVEKIALAVFDFILILVDLLVFVYSIIYIIQRITLKLLDNADILSILFINILFAFETFSLVYALITSIRNDKDMYSTKQKKINKQLQYLDYNFDKITDKHYY